MKSPIRIGIIDSGVFMNHPHVGGVVGGVTVEADTFLPEFSDRLGHGTAIASLIHALAPDAALTAVRVFDHSLATSVNKVMRAIDWCIDHQMDIINLSLGTVNPAHRSLFAAAVERVRTSGTALVSAAFNAADQAMLPGHMPGAIAVAADASCPSNKLRMEERDGKLIFSASPYPLEIPGVPRERNLSGVSFSVAHVSAHLARLLSNGSPCDGFDGDWEQLLAKKADAFVSA